MFMKKLFLLTAIIIAGYSFAYAQKNISGKVTSKKTGAPLPGVSVIVPGTDKATQTDANGNFSLNKCARQCNRLLFHLLVIKPLQQDYLRATRLTLNWKKMPGNCQKWW